MYQSYHSTKWPIVPATMLIGRRGRFRTSESPGGLEVPEASGEFVVIERSLVGVVPWLVWCRAGWVVPCWETSGLVRRGHRRARRQAAVEGAKPAVQQRLGVPGPVELAVPGSGCTSRHRTRPGQ